MNLFFLFFLLFFFWGGGELTDLSSGCDVMFPLESFKTKCPSLLRLLRFVMTIDGKYKTSRVFTMSI